MGTLTYSVQETAALLGVSSMTITRQVDAGKIPAIKIGHRRMVPRAYVEELFAKSGYPLEQETAADATV